MRNWDTRDENGSDTGCEWEKDWEDVQRVCKKLNIPCTMVCGQRYYCKHSLTSFTRQVDLSREYWNNVFEPALQVWREGRTPNPDVSCNRRAIFRKVTAALSDHDSVKRDQIWSTPHPRACSRKLVGNRHVISVSSYYCH
jgi:tRNA-5-taurinomethyluridine 2-sulfurtransferase